MYKPFRILLYLVEALLVLELVALIIMSTAWFQHMLERQVIARLETITGGRVEIAYFRFRPWLFQIILQKLVIHGLESAGDPPLMSVGVVDVGLSPEEFLRQRFRLRHLDMDELQIHLRVDSKGVTNLPGTGEQGLRELLNLSVGRLTISHSAIFWNDQRQPLEVETRELALLLRLTQGRYTGSISSSATTIRSSIWSSSISFNSRFDLSPTSLVFSSLAWQAQGTAGEASFTIVPRPVLEASGFFHATTDVATLGRVLRVPELRAGALLIEGVALYQGGAISAQGRAQARQISILTPALPLLRMDATTSYALEKNQLDLTNLLVSLWGGKVQGRFEANFESAPAKFRLNSRLYQVQLDNLLRSATAGMLPAEQLHPSASASGALNATWSGPGEALKADFDLSLEAPAAAASDVLPVSGTARGAVEDGRGLTIHLDDSEFQTRHSRITARGTLSERPQAPAGAEPLALTVSTDDFEEWRPFFQALAAAPSHIPLRLRSRAEFSGLVRGTYQEPSLEGRVTMGPFVYRGCLWDRLTAGVALNPGFIQISAARVEREKSSFELNASAQLDEWRVGPSSMIRFSAHAQHTPVEGLSAAVNSDFPLRGSVTGRVEVEGTTSTLAGSGSLRIDGGAFADEPFDAFSTQLRVENSTWKLQNITLTKNHGHLTGDVVFEPERRFASGQLQGRDFRLADFRRLPTTASLARPDGRLDGDLNFEARGQGTPEDFRLQSSWRFQNLSAAGTSVGEFHGTLTGEGQELRLEGEDQGAGGNMHLTARTTVRGDWPMEAEGEYSGLRADPWIRAFFNRNFGATLSLGGSFRATGPLRDPAKIDLQSNARDVALGFPSIQWHNVQPVDARVADGRLTLRRFVMRGPSTELGIDGAVIFTGAPALDLNVEGTADATLLTMFDSHLQATGRSTLRVRMSGPPAGPRLNGAIEIQGVSLDYSGLPSRFNELQGTIDLQGERAVIRTLRGSSGGGTVSFNGFVTLVENPRFEVRADLSQVRVRYPTNFTSVLDGHLRLAGDSDGGQLTGDLVVHQMVLNENVNFIAKIIESSNPVPEPPVNVTSPLASKIRLNVRVTSSPPVQLQVPNLRLVGDIDLRLQGDVSSPVQVGSIRLLRGESVFRGNRYTLVRGDLSMTNPFRTEPYLDLEAQTHVQNYDLTLDVSGPFDRLKFSYRADPPLGNSDIVSLLALGYVQQEQAFATVGGNPAASIGASAILSEALSSQTTSRIQRLFGVSRIKIDPNVAVPGFGSGARVTVEQQVTHDVTLTYVTDTSYSQYRIIQFEWNVSDNVSVLGVRDQNGVFGMELRFRRRFK